jgi:hypothetical protein
MERTRWTDDLIDERMASIDHKLDRNLEESRLLRAEIGALRTDLSGQIVALRTDLGGEIAGLRTDLSGQLAGLRTDVGGQIADMRADLWRSQRQLTWIVVSFAVALMGLFGALIAKL